MFLSEKILCVHDTSCFKQGSYTPVPRFSTQIECEMRKPMPSYVLGPGNNASMCITAESNSSLASMPILPDMGG